jgi:acylpyruvate hydrolase
VRLLTFRLADDQGRIVHRVGRIDGAGLGDDLVTEIVDPAAVDVGALLALADWKAIAAAEGPAHRLADLELAPVIPTPSKVICVGLNYKAHILEMGRELPTYPTLFAKFSATLTGPHDDIALPPEDHALDWEGELTIVIGDRCRRVTEAEAAQVIAGYTLANDISMRTWQFRTKEWLQGKMWEASTPVGPALVTSDEWQPGPNLTTRVNGEEMQSAPTSDLLFSPASLVSYVSTMITLEPGDLILTGTPGGVGRAMEPPRFLQPADLVEVEIEGLGRLRNRVVAEADQG